MLFYDQSFIMIHFDNWFKVVAWFFWTANRFISMNSFSGWFSLIVASVWANGLCSCPMAFNLSPTNGGVILCLLPHLTQRAPFFSQTLLAICCSDECTTLSGLVASQPTELVGLVWIDFRLKLHNILFITLWIGTTLLLFSLSFPIPLSSLWLQRAPIWEWSVMLPTPMNPTERKTSHYSPVARALGWVCCFHSMGL